MVLIAAIVVALAVTVAILKWRAHVKEEEERRREYERERLGSDYLHGSASNFDEVQMETKKKDRPA